MAILPDNDRAELWAQFMAEESASPTTGEEFTITKADVRAALDALDDWLDDNAVAANQALPQPARSALSTRQKALLMQFVIQRRYLVGA